MIPRYSPITEEEHFAWRHIMQGRNLYLTDRQHANRNHVFKWTHAGEVEVGLCEANASMSYYRVIKHAGNKNSRQWCKPLALQTVENHLMREFVFANSVYAGILSGAKVTAIYLFASLTVTTSAVQLIRLMMYTADKRLNNDGGVDGCDLSSQHRELHTTRD